MQNRIKFVPELKNLQEAKINEFMEICNYRNANQISFEEALKKITKNEEATIAAYEEECYKIGLALSKGEGGSKSWALYRVNKKERLYQQKLHQQRLHQEKSHQLGYGHFVLPTKKRKKLNNPLNNTVVDLTDSQSKQFITLNRSQIDDVSSYLLSLEQAIQQGDAKMVNDLIQENNYSTLSLESRYYLVKIAKNTIDHPDKLTICACLETRLAQSLNAGPYNYQISYRNYSQDNKNPASNNNLQLPPSVSFGLNNFLTTPIFGDPSSRKRKLIDTNSVTTTTVSTQQHITSLPSNNDDNCFASSHITSRSGDIENTINTENVFELNEQLNNSNIEIGEADNNAAKQLLNNEDDDQIQSKNQGDFQQDEERKKLRQTCINVFKTTIEKVHEDPTIYFSRVFMRECGKVFQKKERNDGKIVRVRSIKHFNTMCKKANLNLEIQTDNTKENRTYALRDTKTMEILYMACCNTLEVTEHVKIKKTKKTKRHSTANIINENVFALFNKELKQQRVVPKNNRSVDSVSNQEQFQENTTAQRQNISPVINTNEVSDETNLYQDNANFLFNYRPTAPSTVDGQDQDSLYLYNQHDSIFPDGDELFPEISKLSPDEYYDEFCHAFNSRSPK